jgi:Protein of unknown function (DUF642)
MLRLTFVVVLLLAASSSIAHAQIITNGSFEQPTVPVGNFTNFPVGSTLITGWTVVNNSVSVVSGSFTQNGVTFPAQDGVQWLDLTGFNTNSNEGVSQNVTTTPGNQYQLSFWIGNTTGGGIFGTTSTVNVSITGVPSFSETNSTVSPTTQFWQQFTHTFVATAATTTLTFTNGDPSTDNDNGLDNISLLNQGPAGAVPEPTSAALVVSGLLGLGLLTRRKRSK